MNEEVRVIYNYNAFVINKNLGDITHEESLIPVSRGGACMNWVLGHIVLTRDYLHEILGLEKFCDEKFGNTYSNGVSEVRNEDAADIKVLLKMFNDSQDKIIKTLEETEIRNDEEKMNNVAGVAFHEAYHSGQLGILRRVAGKSGAIQ